MANNKSMYDSLIVCSSNPYDFYVGSRLLKKIRKFKAPKVLHLENNKIDSAYIISEDKNSTGYEAVLEKVQWLIIVCSPALKQSAWCNKIIDEFISRHDPSHILAVLAEGEPEDSFPEQVLYRDKVVKKPDGSEETIREKIEPLAANFRGNTKKETNKNIEDEYLKMLAPVMGVYYDDLKQRHREQKLRRLRMALSAAFLFVLAVMIYSISSFLILSKQERDIKQQILDINYNTSNTLATQALKQITANNKKKARELTGEALTYLDKSGRSYSKETHAALMNCYNPFSSEYRISAEQMLELDGTVLNVWTDDEESDSELSIAVIYDDSDTLTIWDAADGTVISKIHDVDIKIYDNIDGGRKVSSATMIYDSMFAYTDKGGIRVINVKTGEEVTFIENEAADALYTYFGFLFTLNDRTISFIDTDDWSVYEYFTPYYDIFEKNIYVSSYFIAYVTTETKGKSTLNIIDVQNEIIMTFYYDSDAICIRGVFAVDGNIFIQSNGYTKTESGDYKYKRSDLVCYSNESGYLSEKWKESANLKGTGIGLVKDNKDNLVLFATNSSIISYYGLKGNYQTGFLLGGNLLYENMVTGDVLLSNGDLYLTNLSSARIQNDMWTTNSLLYEKYAAFNEEKMDQQLVRVCSAGYIFVPAGSNRVLAYGNVAKEINPTEMLERLESSTGNNVLYAGEAREYGAKNNIPFAKLIDTVLFDKEGEYFIVSYQNGRASSFKTGSEEPIDSWSLDEAKNLNPLDINNYNLGYSVYADDYDRLPFTTSVKYYLGKDKEGNVYYRGTRCGYVLNSDHQFIAKIPFLFNFDEETNTVFIGNNEEADFYYDKDEPDYASIVRNVYKINPITYMELREQ